MKDLLQARDSLNTMETTKGDILVPTGRGGYVNIAAMSLDELLAKFDRYAAWVIAEGLEPETSPAELPGLRQMVIDSYREGEVRVAAGRSS